MTRGVTMNKAEYKRLSHDIRTLARCCAIKRKNSTRAELHNITWWKDTTKADKFGRDLYKYRCYGDYDTGLVWENRWKI